MKKQILSMSRIPKRRFIAAAVCCLIAGGIALNVVAEEKNKSAKNKDETKQPAIKKLPTILKPSLESTPKLPKASKPSKSPFSNPLYSRPQLKNPPVALPSANLTFAPQMQEIKQIFYPALTPRELKIQEALDTDAVCDFPDIPLSEVIGALAHQHGLTILISDNDLGEEGLTVDEPVNISLNGIRLKYALDLILKPMGLTYVVDRDVVQITTGIKADEMLKTRVYPVGDLCKTPNDYLTLEQAIRNSCLQHWKSKKANVVPTTPGGGAGLGGGGAAGMGGAGSGGGGFFQVQSGAGMGDSIGSQAYEDGTGGTITVVLQSKSLVISQTYQAHNAIVELLTQLRQARALD